MALEGTTPMEFENKPLLEQWGKSYSLTISKLSIKMDLNADLGLGYKALFFWTVANQMNQMAINPFAFVEVGSHNKITVSWSSFFNITGWFHVIPWRFTFADYQGMWSLDNKYQYCQSLGYDQNAFDAYVRVKGEFNECYLGFLNWRTRATNANWKYCTFRTYYPQSKIWKRSTQNQLDTSTSILPWKCNYNVEE